MEEVKKERQHSSYLGKTKKKKNRERNDYIYENRHLPRKEIVHLVAEVYGVVLEEGLVGKIISLEKAKRENK